MQASPPREEFLEFLCQLKSLNELTHVFAELDHAAGGVEGLICDVVSLELEGLQLGQWGPVVGCGVGGHGQGFLCARDLKKEGIKN